MHFNEIFNTFKKKAAETAEVVGEKASEFAEVAKYEMELKRHESDLKKLYIKLGEAVYDAKIKEIDMEDVMNDICSEIKRKKDFIIEIENEAALAKEGRNIKKTKFEDIKETPDFMRRNEEDDKE